MNKKIVLTTLNARYSHASIGLRYLYANLGELQKWAVIQEYTIKEKPLLIAEKILQESPSIIGLGVYIWNAIETQQVIHYLKKISPETLIIIGGPEVSYSPFRVNFDAVDYIIQGEGDLEFFELCKSIFAHNAPETRLIQAKPFDLKQLQLPYQYYSHHDLKNRIIYVEASRGCPFTCEFCLSSLDQKVRNFDIQTLLEQIDILWDRGGRNFKFIDRTFNLSQKVTHQILDFFLSKTPPFFIHFEMIPDHFPENLKEKLKRFQPGSLQLEIGIQTLNPAISTQIKRKLKVDKVFENLQFLTQETDAHLHLDLIVGLPGENINSFGNNLNTLIQQVDCEIQIGILKKLAGTSLHRHDQPFGMVYSEFPPYEILKNDLIPFSQMQDMKRFARFWDLVYNSGNFKKTMQLFCSKGNVFETFLAFSQWLYKENQSTSNISLTRLSECIYLYLTHELNYPIEDVAQFLRDDLSKVKGRQMPSFLKGFLQINPTNSPSNNPRAIKRQLKHSMV